MKKRWIYFLLALTLLCACLPQPPRVHAGASGEYVFAGSVEIGKTYVIVADGTYALTNRQEGPALHSYADDAETTLASAPVTVEDGVITGGVTEDMLWTVVESTAPEAYDGMEQYFLRDQNGNYLRRGSGSGGDGAQLLAEPELYEKIRFNTWSFYPRDDGTFAMYANSERAYGRDCPYYLFGNETSFDSPSRIQRTAAAPFAFAYYDDCSGIRLFEAVGYTPCAHEFEPVVTAPTCTERGHTTYTCALCGKYYVSDYTDELLHDWPKEGAVAREPTETERGVLTFTCSRCGQTRERPLAAGSERAHKNEILFISDLHSGRNAENGYHNLRAMFRLLRENDDFVPEVVAGGGDYLESRTYDDVDWPHCFEVLHDIMYQASPDTAQVLTAGNHEWEWSRQSDEMLEKLLGTPRVCHSYSSEDFEIFQIGAHTNDSGKEHFLEEDIEKLRGFLESVAGSGKVIFIQTHWPLHYGYNSDQWRTVTNAGVMIDLLNEYAETLDICFVWGHNHNEDATRHKLFRRGDELQITKEETKQIRFTYVNAGCLNERHAKEGAGPDDSYYGPGYLLEARIEGDRLILDYGHITGAWPDPDEALYDHNADLLYVEEIQEARPSHYEIQLLHTGECEHVFSETVTAPTCTEPGYTTYTCSRCGAGYTGGETAALGHEYEAAVTAPTCTQAGFTTHTCLRCGDSYTDGGTPALGHGWDEGKITQEPTETAPGVLTFTCTRCGETKTQSVPPLEHKHSYSAAVTAPTCTQAGFTTYTCACGDSYIGDKVGALGHDYRQTVTEPTCTEPGHTAYTCVRCGDSYTADETPAQGHDFREGVCARCGQADPDYDPPADKEELNGVIEDAGKLDTTPYTPQSVAALEDAVAAARKVQADENATQKAVDDAVAAVAAAIRGLEEKPTAPTFRFDDVRDETRFYFDPVYWAFAAQPQITNGVDETHFCPDANCTRGQVVTFLWRAAGCPAPGSTVTAFADLRPGGFYTEAVAWAVENGITDGVTPTTFAPDAACTRGQIVTFLWRANGQPKARDPANPFADVPAGKFYTEAVLWAVEKGVTEGVSATKFAPDAACTRGQIVTFLYRDSRD